MNQVHQDLVEKLKSNLRLTKDEVRYELGEVTLTLAALDLPTKMTLLRDASGLKFNLLLDVCGMDYRDYPSKDQCSSRFAVVYHLLSIDFNHRVRVRIFCDDDEQPSVSSVVDIWPGANWFEREAFDLFGIVFDGHPDLRRLLTDYGFVGHPLRKDFRYQVMLRCVTTP